jgi:hypothetical protein
MWLRASSALRPEVRGRCARALGQSVIDQAVLVMGLHPGCALDLVGPLASV